MSDCLPPAVLKLAEGLCDDEIHIWALPYDRASGRLPLRRLLAGYLGTVLDDVVLTDATHGRPELGGTHGGRIRFNWSHSGDRALVAVARSVQPGIDLEHRARRGARDVLALAQRFFAAQEAQALAALPAEERSSAFLQLWTVKEAVLKAQGRGLAYGLHRVVVDLRESGPALVCFDDEPTTPWHVQALSPGPAWVAAVAWCGPPMHVRWCGEPH